MGFGMESVGGIARAALLTALLGGAMLGGCTGHEKGESSMSERAESWDGVKNVKQEGRYTFSGQPTEGALAAFAEGGGAMVVDLRAQSGSDAADFDEKARVEGLGMDYVHIPVSPASFSTMDVKKFIEATRQTDGPILVHCASANRVGAMWASYLALEKGMPTDEAIDAGKAAGLRSAELEDAVRRVVGR